MLKILARTLAILCVCGLIAAIIYALVQANPSVGVGGPHGEFRPPAGQERAFDPQAARPEHFDRDDEGGIDLARGLAGMFGHFLLIAVIVLAVVTAQKLPARLFGSAPRGG